MITDDGWQRHNIWEHSETIRQLYLRRCRLEAEEMTCAAQAAEILASHVTPGDSLLDVGCGSGYFFHSLARREIPVEYYGIDGAPSLIRIGQEEMPAYGLPAERLRVMRIDDVAGEVDHVLCMNVLSNLDNYHRSLDRMLRIAGKTLILRESTKSGCEYKYVRDEHLDNGVALYVYVNAYDTRELMEFIRARGFAVSQIEDRRSKGEPEMVIGYAHYWTFFLAVRH